MELDTFNECVHEAIQENQEQAKHQIAKFEEKHLLVALPSLPSPCLLPQGPTQLWAGPRPHTDAVAPALLMTPEARRPCPHSSVAEPGYSLPLVWAPGYFPEPTPNPVLSPSDFISLSSWTRLQRRVSAFNHKFRLVSTETCLAHTCILFGLQRVLKHFEHPADIRNGKISQKNDYCQLLWRQLSSVPEHQLSPLDRPCHQSPRPSLA